MTLIVEILKNGLFQGALIALIAVGFSLVYATTRVFHIAIGALYLWSSYVAVFVGQNRGSLAVACLAAAATAAVLGLLLDRSLYRRFQAMEASGSIRLLGSLSVLVISSGVIALIWGNQPRGVNWWGPHATVFRGFVLSTSDAYHLGAALLTGLTLGLVIHRTNLGLHVRACADDPSLFELLGYPSSHLRALVSVVAAVPVGIAAGLQTYRIGIDPAAAWPITVSGVVAAIIGGRSLVLGPILGALLIGVVRSGTTFLFSDYWKDTPIYLLLLIVLLVHRRPLRDSL